jgi:hypothetical protein
MNAGNAAARKQLVGHACERLWRLTRKMLQDFLRVRRREDTDDMGLLWYHDMSQVEAAAVLNVSLATVKRWWLSARLRLQPARQGRGQ